MIVLIVDDEPIARAALKEALATQGKLKFKDYEDGNAAWQAIDAGLTPAICLLDVRMPGLNGVDVLARFRNDLRFKGIPVMLITSMPERNVVVKASALGIDGILIKPIENRQAAGRIFPLLDQFIATLLASPGKTRQKLNLDHKKYLQTLEDLLQKGKRTVGLLQGDAGEDGLRQALAKMVSMRTTAELLGANHLVACLDRAAGLLENPATQGDGGEGLAARAAGIVNVGLGLFQDGLDWNGLSFKPAEAE